MGEFMKTKEDGTMRIGVVGYSSQNFDEERARQIISNFLQINCWHDETVWFDCS